MNYFLFVVILALCAGAYYTHTQDQQTIANLQAQLDRTPTKAPATVATSDSTTAPTSSPHAPTAPTANPGLTHDLDPASPSAPLHHVIVTANPDDAHSTAIDSAAAAAQAASGSADLGTITTLDNHTYTNCKVVKVDTDGVIFSDDTGITKIEYPMMTSNLQKKFGYAAPSSP